MIKLEDTYTIDLLGFSGADAEAAIAALNRTFGMERNEALRCVCSPVPVRVKAGATAADARRFASVLLGMGADVRVTSEWSGAQRQYASKDLPSPAPVQRETQPTPTGSRTVVGEALTDETPSPGQPVRTPAQKMPDWYCAQVTEGTPMSGRPAVGSKRPGLGTWRPEKAEESAPAARRTTTYEKMQKAVAGPKSMPAYGKMKVEAYVEWGMRILVILLPLLLVFGIVKLATWTPAPDEAESEVAALPDSASDYIVGQAQICDEGRPNGCYELGIAYTTGEEGVRRSRRAGSRLLRIACDAGIGDACLLY